VEEKGGAVEAPPADIRPYLKPTGLMEIRYIRMLSSLCNETYYLSKLSVSYLTPHVPLYWLRTMHVSQTSCQRAQQRVMSTLVLPLTACLFLQKRTIRLRHKLDLVTTSHECAHVAKEVPRTAAQIMEDGDAMASNPPAGGDCPASSSRELPKHSSCHGGEPKKTLHVDISLLCLHMPALISV